MKRGVRLAILAITINCLTSVTGTMAANNPASFDLHHDSVPNFAQSPTIQSTQNGNWSSASTLSPAQNPQTEKKNQFLDKGLNLIPLLKAGEFLNVSSWVEELERLQLKNLFYILIVKWAWLPLKNLFFTFNYILKVRLAWIPMMKVQQQGGDKGIGSSSNMGTGANFDVIPQSKRGKYTRKETDDKLTDS